MWEGTKRGALGGVTVRVGWFWWVILAVCNLLYSLSFWEKKKSPYFQDGTLDVEICL